MVSRDIPLDALPEPALVVAADGEIRAVNRVGADRWGDVAGTSLSALVVDDTDLDAFLERPGAESWQVEVRFSGGADRTWLASVTVRPLNETEGLLVARDVTKQRELERDRGMLDALLEHTPVVVYFKDRRSRYVRVSDSITELPAVNDEGKVHPAPEDFIGKTNWDLFPRPIAERTIEDDRRVVLRGDVIKNREQRSEAADGTTMWHSTSKVPWYGENGAIRGVVGVTRDVSDRKRYELELERQNDRLADFAHAVSHDVRNPLNVAIAALDMYRKTGEQSHLERAERMHERIEQLIDDTLDLARSGEWVTDPESVDVETLAKDAWANVETENATLSVELDSTVAADPDRLRRLFENLFRNSVEHGSTNPRSASPHEDAVEHGSTSPGPEDSKATVAVTVGSLPDKRGFFVADDGPGIPPDERETVFDRGYTTSEEGTGFGLSIVGEIVDAHGWTIEVTESEDNGACFEIVTTGETDD